MTREEAKREEAKRILYVYRAVNLVDASHREAFDMAIASLEAWGKIKQEINDLFSKPAYYMPNYDAYKMFLEIIDKHLQEVK